MVFCSSLQIPLSFFSSQLCNVNSRLSHLGVCACVCIPSMGVRVMDTNWVSRKGSSTLVRKTSSTPPGLQGPGSADNLIRSEEHTSELQSR